MIERRGGSAPINVAISEHLRRPYRERRSAGHDVTGPHGCGPSRVLGSRDGTECWASDGDEADRRVERLEQASEVGGVGRDQSGGACL
jgi:hypothetical protein